MLVMILLLVLVLGSDIDPSARISVGGGVMRPR